MGTWFNEHIEYHLNKPIATAVLKYIIETKKKKNDCTNETAKEFNHILNVKIKIV